MSVPADQMSPDQMDLAMAMMRRNQGPLAWNSAMQGTQSTGQNGGQQTSQVGPMNMLTPLAKALILRGGSSSLPGPTAASSLQAMGAPDTGNLFGLSGITGSNLAPATTPTLGLDATGTAADTAAYTPAAMDATSGAGAGLGAAGAGGIMAGIVGAALGTQPYTLDATYWNRMRSGLTQGTSGNATYDKYTPPAQQEYNSKENLYNMLKQYGTGPMTHSGFGQGANRIPGDVVALAKSYGMLNADGSLNKNWSGGPDPFVSAYHGPAGGGRPR